MNITREELIRLCELNSAVASNFATQESPQFHKEHGLCWALLTSGCDYRLVKEESNFLILDIYYPAFKMVDNTTQRYTQEFLQFVLAKLPKP